MFEEDLNQFLSENDFAVEATYDGTKRIKVIFDSEFADVPLGVVGFEARNPFAWARSEDVDTDIYGKTLTLVPPKSTTAITYTIVRQEPDGTGMTRLILNYST